MDLDWRSRSEAPPLSAQGVHDSRGIHEDYLKLESLIQKVVSPYLGTHGLFSGDGTDAHCCVLGEKRPPRDGAPPCLCCGT